MHKARVIKRKHTHTHTRNIKMKRSKRSELVTLFLVYFHHSTSDSWCSTESKHEIRLKYHSSQVIIILFFIFVSVYIADAFIRIVVDFFSSFACLIFSIRSEIGFMLLHNICFLFVVVVGLFYIDWMYAFNPFQVPHYANGGSIFLGSLFVVCLFNKSPIQCGFLCCIFLIFGLVLFSGIHSN